MKHKLLFILIICAFACAHAETKQDRQLMKHELRIGWGDQLFESLVWHNPTNIISTMPETARYTYQEDFHHDQHVWLEYQHRPNGWFSYGGMIDASDVRWTNVARDGRGQEVNRDPGHYFCNIVVMPTIRFTYLHHQYVNMYFGIGFGMGINFGTEQNAQGKHTDVGAAASISVIGLSANYKRWFWTLDAGGLYSMKNMNTIFLASSRIISVGLGVRF
ncbi:MAG: hypothetical protein IJ776_06035 [Paludibacteraceae bacterium]|nr:hypothetical protein [Paludibacteraceae bacterium]